MKIENISVCVYLNSQVATARVDTVEDTNHFYIVVGFSNNEHVLIESIKMSYRNKGEEVDFKSLPVEVREDITSVFIKEIETVKQQAQCKSERFIMVKGDIVIFSEDFEYLSKDVRYLVEEIDRTYIYFKNENKESRTFSKRNILLMRKQRNPDLYHIEQKQE